MPIAAYLKALEANLLAGNATEHTHRPALKNLMEGIVIGVTATNEPKRSACGAPDFEITRTKDRLCLGFVEAKDTHVDLAIEQKSEQLTRYRRYLANLLFTNGHEFRWYVDGKEMGKATLATLMPSGKVHSDAAMQANTLTLLKNFLSQRPIDIATAEDLAKRLAHFTHLIRDIIVTSFANGSASPLVRGWREAFALTLLPELAVNLDAEKEAKAVASFADMLAQTLAYGLFSARSSAHGVTFTRDLAKKLIPATNPFLRDFFYQITGPGLDDEPFAGFVDDIIQTLAHSNMDKILDDFGKRGPRRDPMLHFYETFLQAYDPALRELRGVYYTPEPVVNYIVESVDHLLKDRFGIKAGLADTGKISYTVDSGLGKPETKECHRVLILDPATGTATFLYRVMDFIREKMETGKKGGQWSSYVHEHLLPRLFGFELLMAPYAIAHFKLGLALAAYDKEPLFRKEWAYAPHSGERLNIFLTNTLEDLERTASQLPPLQILSNEANAAYEIKKHKPVLCVIGNPPYSNFGQQNRGEWILGLLNDYKKGLNEKKLNLNDDFIKFVRWAQWRIQQTGQGIVGYITNNVYLDGLTHRRMRESLLETFDEIHVLNLHGSAKKKETTPEGGKDDNVFDIMVGVAIVIFVKLPDPAGNKAKKANATVKYVDLWGKRAEKYKWLDAHDVSNPKWTKLKPHKPGFYFVPGPKGPQAEYEDFWGLRSIFEVAGNGVKTERDGVSISFNESEVEATLDDFRKLNVEKFRQKYELGEDSRDWSIERAKQDVLDHQKESLITPILYRPFDTRFTWFSGRSKGFIGTPAAGLMHHMLCGENLAVIATRQTKEHFSVLATTSIAGHKSCASYDINSVFPLYIYSNGHLDEDECLLKEDPPEEERRPNFSKEFIADLCKRMNVTFTREGLGEPKKRIVGPELVFHYAYAVFHSPAYRARYAEFLRTDFPRLPLTRNYDLFRTLAGFGGHLVDLHARGKGDGEGIGFPIKSDNVISELRWEKVEGASRSLPEKKKERDAPSTLSGRVWINDKQYFSGVPQEAWEFPIGGYLPAQRWLKDRMGRTLGFDEMEEWPRIVNALLQTGRLMRDIDAAITEHGGFPQAFA